MSRLGAAGAVAQLVADVPLSSVEVVHFLIFYYFYYLNCISFQVASVFFYPLYFQSILFESLIYF